MTNIHNTIMNDNASKFGRIHEKYTAEPIDKYIFACTRTSQLIANSKL